MSSAEPHEAGAGDLVALLVRCRVAVVAVVLAATSIRHVMSGKGDWNVFVNASELLFGVRRPWFHLPGGLHVFANYPEYQIGPLSAVVATPFRLAGDTGRRLVIVAMLLALVAMYRAIDRVAVRGDPQRAITSLAAGVCLAVGWVPLAANYVHLDDALALAALVGVVVAIDRGRPVAAGILIGLAIASKPWAVLFAPMLLAAPTRDRWPRGAVAMVAVASAAWLPFVLGDLDTLHAASPQVDVSTASVLHLFGVPRGVGPAWVRTVQLGVGLVLAAAVVARGRWVAAPMVALAVRVMLDPGVFSYYAAGLLVATVLWDVLASRWRVPVATIVAFVGLDVVEIVVGDASVQGALRLVTCLVLVCIGWAGATRSERPATSDAQASVSAVA